MKRIGILSDTHGHIPESIYVFFERVDEIWHAGDIGSTEIIEKLSAFKPLKGVYGNIDGTAIRLIFPEQQIFVCEEAKVFITHIGGYPGKYVPNAQKTILKEKPDIFVCGHSHILKVIFDTQFNLLHINPGAAGNSGFHTHITLIRCEIEKGKVTDLQVYDVLRR